MTIKPGRMVTYLFRLLTIKGIQRFDHVVLQGHVTNKNHLFPPTARTLMATKLDWMISYMMGSSYKVT